MFTDLGFIDWIALAFAAVLLAGAAAAAFLAYATTRARTSEPTNGYAHAATSVAGVGSPASPRAHGATAKVRDVDAEVIDLTDHRPQHSTEDSVPLEFVRDLTDTDVGPMHAAMPLPEVTTMDIPACETMSNTVIDYDGLDDDPDVEAQLASRAARLRGRPVAEAVPAAEVTDQHVYSTIVHDIDPPAVNGADERPDRVGFEVRVPGFFDDPMGRHELRYWDGRRWTEYVKERGERFTDPL